MVASATELCFKYFTLHKLRKVLYGNSNVEQEMSDEKGNKRLRIKANNLYLIRIFQKNIEVKSVI